MYYQLQTKFNHELHWEALGDFQTQQEATAFKNRITKENLRGPGVMQSGEYGISYIQYRIIEI